MSATNANVSQPEQALPYPWAPIQSGNWKEDNQIGHDLAAKLLAYMKATGNPTVLGHLMKTMIERGEYGGVEVGFFHAISEHLLKQYRDEGSKQ